MIVHTLADSNWVFTGSVSTVTVSNKILNINGWQRSVITVRHFKFIYKDFI
jgi:hypothetical protein